MCFCRIKVSSLNTKALNGFIEVAWLTCFSRFNSRSQFESLFFLKTLKFKITPEKLTCHLNRDHFKRKYHFPTIDFHRIFVSFRGSKKRLEGSIWRPRRTTTYGYSQPRIIFWEFLSVAGSVSHGIRLFSAASTSTLTPNIAQEFVAEGYVVKRVRGTQLKMYFTLMYFSGTFTVNRWKCLSLSVLSVTF